MGKLCKTGKRKQKVYDAIKKAREEGDAWLTLDGYRLKLQSPDDFDFYKYCKHYDCLVKHNGKIVRTLVHYKDGIRAEEIRKPRIQASDICAVIVEEHER